MTFPCLHDEFSPVIKTEVWNLPWLTLISSDIYLELELIYPLIIPFLIFIEAPYCYQ